MTYKPIGAHDIFSADARLFYPVKKNASEVTVETLVSIHHATEHHKHIGFFYESLSNVLGYAHTFLL